MMRVALVGFGRIAPRHLEVLRALGCTVDVSVNRSEAGRNAAVAHGGIRRTYSSVPEMMERERPDGVLCCVSFAQSAAVARALIPFGAPILLEKPPGTSLSEYEALRALAASAETPVMVGLNRRSYSVINRALADAGGTAAVTDVSVEWSENPASFLARGFSPEDVSRLIFANSLHGLDLLSYLGGPLMRTHVSAVSHGPPFRWQMSLQGIGSGGALATFRSSWENPGPWRVAMGTSERRYVFAPLETCVVMEGGVERHRAIEPDDVDMTFKPGFHRQAAAFVSMIESRQAPPDLSLEAASEGMRLADLLTNACLAAETERP